MNKNIIGYIFREIAVQLIKAVKAYQNYNDFKRYANTAIPNDLMEIVDSYDGSALGIKGKIITWLIKHKCWFVFEKIYR